MKDIKKEKKSITLDSDIIKEIEKLAENDDRSFSQYLNMILRKYLKSTDKCNNESKK